VFLSRKPKASHLNVYRFCYHARAPDRCALLRGVPGLLKHLVCEGFCPRNCPFLNETGHGARNHPSSLC
jgi:hypothetical protein